MSSSEKKLFIHLKCHTEYSIRNGLLRIKPWLERVTAMDMPAVAITDHANLFGLVKFLKYAIPLGIKPIVGAEICLKINNALTSATLLCQNFTGYHHLLKLLSLGYTEGQNLEGQSIIAWDWLEQFGKGLIVLSGGGKGDIGQALLAKNFELASSHAQRWKQHFSQRFYLEISRTGRNQEEIYNEMVIQFARSQQLPLVATNDVCFLEKEDFIAHETRVCINSGHILQDNRRQQLYSEQQYLRSPAEMHQLFSDIPEAIENTVLIAERCNLPLTFGEVHLPCYPITNAELNVDEYFTQEVKKGWEWRKNTGGVHARHLTLDEYEQRLQQELDVIKRMGFASYFLIVADFISWAKKQDIPVGPGRGSGAGSLVAYVLGITELDPLHHELLFERFLNPERVSMPDFDIDFCMEGRDRVIEYVAERYGREAVAQIITFGTMAAKAVVRDVGRVLALPYSFVDKIAKLIPFELGITLEKALEDVEELAKRYQTEEEVTHLIDLAKKLEGIARNAGKHAGGVVIAPTKLIDFVPLYCEPGKENIVTQFDKDDVETVGLVKFDFLGLRTLTIIHWAIQSINQKLSLEGKSLIDINHIPFDDVFTFTTLCKSTTAIFQLESRGMRDLVKRLQPSVFEEITALVALFRPGPLQSGMVEDFIARKHGQASVEYPHPDLKPILQTTYGVILYQEQVMQIAQALAGYSLGEADILRRAMGKKKAEEMAKQRQKFVDGASQKNITREKSEYIFDLMEKFAGYGFNKSHSAAYALLTYQTAWLKAHYPAEFMAAVLSSDMDNTDKTVNFINECKSMSLTLLPPNINVSFYKFTVNASGAIEYGLGAIKGVGEAAVEHLIAEREKNGLYSNLFDFCKRLDLRKITRRALEPLIYSGAMDIFNKNRATILNSLDDALKQAEQTQRNQVLGQEDLFGKEATTDEFYTETAEWNDLHRLANEKSVIGFYFSGHPLQTYEHELSTLGAVSIAELENYQHKPNVLCAGLLISQRILYTKRGNQMAIIGVEDKTGRIEVALFSQLFEQVKPLLQMDQVYLLRGLVEEDNFTGGIRFKAESVESLNTLRERYAKRISFSIDNAFKAERLIEHLPQLFKQGEQGKCEIIIRYQGENTKANLLLGETWRIKLTPALLESLKQAFPSDQWVIEY